MSVNKTQEETYPMASQTVGIFLNENHKARGGGVDSNSLSLLDHLLGEGANQETGLKR